jgi:hypothetical protein
MSNVNFQLHCDNFGRLVLTDADGVRHEGVTPVRAFPIAAPDEGLSLVNFEGHEVAWWTASPTCRRHRDIVEADLRSREFVPEIERIVSVSSFACPSTWQVRPIAAGRAGAQGRGRHPPPVAEPPADRRRQRHSVPDPRPEHTGPQSRKLLDRFL